MPERIYTSADDGEFEALEETPFLARMSSRR